MWMRIAGLHDGDSAGDQQMRARVAGGVAASSSGTRSASASATSTASIIQEFESNVNAQPRPPAANTAVNLLSRA